jgi:DNA-binding response OmpR family regulator
MKTVLVIDDESNIRKSIEFCLEQAGYSVVIAQDGLSGMQKALETKPDLILLDLVLPKMNGYLVCEALKSEESTSSIPLVIMSAKAEEEDIEKARMHGADDYMVKPFTPDELRKKVKEKLK